MSLGGQTEKNSARAHLVRFTPDSDRLGDMPSRKFYAKKFRSHHDTLHQLGCARSLAGQPLGAFERGPGNLARRGWINASKVWRSSLGAYQGLKPGSWKGSINGSRAQPTLPPILVTGPVDDG